MPIALFQHILRHTAATDAFTVYYPSQDLRFLIRYFFVYTADQGVAQELAFADGLPGIVFLLDEPNEYCFLTNQDEYLQRTGYIVASLLEGIYIQKSPALKRLLGVRFTYEGLYHLLKQPVHELGQEVAWDLYAIFGSQAKGWQEIMQDAIPITDKIRYIEQFFRQRINPAFTPNAIFREAVNKVQMAKGQLTINQLAGSLKVNYKWLERNFRTYLGITPKEYARQNRFLHAYFELQQTRGIDLMGVAIHNGYYDQNHFAKEFKQFTRKTPLSYIQESWLEYTPARDRADLPVL
jgi:AraC-like DNA-binding protein